LLDLEKEVIAFAARVGATLLPQVRPTQLYGLEINPYAAELAQVVIWIGFLQWTHHNGFAAPRDPILRSIDTIRNMDAIIDLSDPDNPKEPEWPEADVIVGNPPFLGGKMLRRNLGNEYIDAVLRLYRDRVPAEADLCCYWFERSRAHMVAGRCCRGGLLATQGIRGGANRAVVEAIRDTAPIFFAVSDREWILDGAAVHVSIIGFQSPHEMPAEEVILDGKPVATINPNLTATADTTACKPLAANRGLSFMGITPAAPFDQPYCDISDWLHSPNAAGRPNSDVMRPYFNGADTTRRPRGHWTIDFHGMAQETAAGYELPFDYVRRIVKPERDKNNRQSYREKWWLYAEAREGMRAAFGTKPRYLATCMVAKHRLFSWLPAESLPANVIIAFAFDDDFSLGIMHSRAHVAWAAIQGTQLREKESGDRYTPTSCFETFPFPEPTAAQRDAIAAAAKELDTLRSNWLNPPEWTREEVLTFPGSVDGPWARYVTEPNAKGIGAVRYPRIVPADDAAAKKLAKRTLTNLYNERPTWLDLAHKRLDEAVFAAYGWPTDLSDDDLLARLLALNLERANAE